MTYALPVDGTRAREYVSHVGARISRGVVKVAGAIVGARAVFVVDGHFDVVSIHVTILDGLDSRGDYVVVEVVIVMKMAV